MRRANAPVLAAAVLLLAACGPSGNSGDIVNPTAPAPVPSADTASSAPTTPPATPEPTAAADGTDTGECRDGTCEVEVDDGTTIPIGDEFGIDELVVQDVTKRNVTIVAYYESGGYGQTSVGVGGRAGFNDLLITCLALDDGTAILSFDVE